MELRTVLQISIRKTLYLNYHYFGLKGMLRLPVIVSRNLKIAKAKGKISAPEKCASVLLGFGNPGIADRRYQRAIFEVGGGELIFEGRAVFAPGTRIVNSGKIIFGENFDMKASSTVICEEAIVFGKDTLISWECLVMDTDFHTIYDGAKKDGNKLNNPQKISIGNHVWIGCRCSILKGSHIPDGSVVGAGSIVCKRLEEENSVYCGNRVVRHPIAWRR